MPDIVIKELKEQLDAALGREKVYVEALLDCEDQMSMADGGCANCSSYPDGKVVLCKLHEALALFASKHPLGD